MRRSSVLVFVIVTSLISSQSLVLAGGPRGGKGNRKAQVQKKTKVNRGVRGNRTHRAGGAAAGQGGTRLSRLAQGKKTVAPKNAAKKSKPAMKTPTKTKTAKTKTAKTKTAKTKTATQTRTSASSRARSSTKAPRSIRSSVLGYGSKLIGLATVGALLADIRTGWTAKFSEFGETFFQNDPKMMLAGAVAGVFAYAVGRTILRRSAKTNTREQSSPSETEIVASGLAPQPATRGLRKSRALVGYTAYSVAAATAVAALSDGVYQWSSALTGGEGFVQSNPAVAGLGAFAIISVAAIVGSWATPEGSGGSVPGITGESGFDGGGTE